jgi:hypothetical protein
MSTSVKMTAADRKAAIPDAESVDDDAWGEAEEETECDDECAVHASDCDGNCDHGLFAPHSNGCCQDSGRKRTAKVRK